MRKKGEGDLNKWQIRKINLNNPLYTGMKRLFA